MTTQSNRYRKLKQQRGSFKSNPKKDDNTRPCVDMRAANNAIKCVRHPIPTVKGISLELNGAKFFSKLYLSQAYHQLELTPSCRYITIFTTRTSLYRFKRLNYGTNSAAEIFQHRLQQVLRGIKGVPYVYNVWKPVD